MPSPNSSGISVSVAPAALPMPSARWPALRPIAITKYQREVVFASTIRFFTMLDADVARGLEAEGVDVGGRSRSLSIVFGTCTTRMRPCAFSSSFIAEKAVSSPPIVMSCETLSRSSEMTVFSRCSGFLRRVRARDADVRAAAEVDAAHLVDGQRAHVVDVALHDPLEAVADAEDLDALEHAADGRGADDAVDAGGGAAADENGQSLLMAHGQHLGIGNDQTGQV